jgi:hypothetical protein
MLVAIKTSSVNVSCSLTWNAFDSSLDFASTAILKFLNLITRRGIVVPFVNYRPIVFSLIPAILFSLLFASKAGNNRYGNGNGNFFHNG